MHTYVPIQGIVLHSTVSSDSPMQLLPPQDGAGLLQVLVFVLFPPPHNFEQFPTNQFDQPPSTMYVYTIQYKYVHGFIEMVKHNVHDTCIHTYTNQEI